MNVEDFDESTANELIDNIFINITLDPSDHFDSVSTYGTGEEGSITLQFKVECEANSFGLNCLTSKDLLLFTFNCVVCFTRNNSVMYSEWYMYWYTESDILYT